MLNYIRDLPDPWMVLAIIGIGAVFWAAFAALFFLTDKIKSSNFYRYSQLERELERENAYLRKKIREERNHG